MDDISLPFHLRFNGQTVYNDNIYISNGKALNMDFKLKPQSGDTIAVPRLVFARLDSADEVSVRVALYVLATGITDPEKIAHDLKLRSVHAAESSLLWWAGAGLLEKVTPENTPQKAPAAPLSWAQIASATRTDPMIANLMDCAQNAFGRPLSRTEMQKLLRFYLQDGFDPEVIMLCLTYLAGEEKKTLGELNHELKAWQNEGVVTGEDADRHLKKLALRRKREDFVCELLNVPHDTLTLGEKRAICRWYEEYGYDDTMTSEAALQAGSNQDVWYLNGILRKWYGKGLRTIHEVRGYGANDNAASRNVRVDRVQPSGNDFLKNAVDRPRRLKRKD